MSELEDSAFGISWTQSAKFILILPMPLIHYMIHHLFLLEIAITNCLVYYLERRLWQKKMSSEIKPNSAFIQSLI